MDETGAYYTEGTKSEREPSIHYINAYIWTLERRLQRSYTQGNKRDRCKEQTFGVCGRRRGWDDLRE